MTTSQIIALGMPLLTAAVVGLVVLFVRRPWRESKQNPSQSPAP